MRITAMKSKVYFLLTGLFFLCSANAAECPGPGCKPPRKPKFIELIPASVSFNAVKQAGLYYRAKI